jgi:hypothetical protein
VGRQRARVEDERVRQLGGDRRHAALLRDRFGVPARAIEGTQIPHDCFAVRARGEPSSSTTRAARARAVAPPRVPRPSSSSARPRCCTRGTPSSRRRRRACSPRRSPAARRAPPQMRTQRGRDRGGARGAPPLGGRAPRALPCTDLAALYRRAARRRALARRLPRPAACASDLDASCRPRSATAGRPAVGGGRARAARWSWATRRSGRPAGEPFGVVRLRLPESSRAPSSPRSCPCSTGRALRRDARARAARSAPTRSTSCRSCSTARGRPRRRRRMPTRARRADRATAATARRTAPARRRAWRTGRAARAAALGRAAGRPARARRAPAALSGLASPAPRVEVRRRALASPSRPDPPCRRPVAAVRCGGARSGPPRSSAPAACSARSPSWPCARGSPSASGGARSVTPSPPRPAPRARSRPSPCASPARRPWPSAARASCSRSTRCRPRRA